MSDEIVNLDYEPLVIPVQAKADDLDYKERQEEYQRWRENEYAQFIKFDIDKEELETFEAMFGLTHGGNGFRNKLSKIASRTYQPDKGRALTPNFRLRLDNYGNSEVWYKGALRIRFEPYHLFVDNVCKSSWDRDGDDFGRLFRSIVPAYTDYTPTGYYGSGPVRLKNYEALLDKFDPYEHDEVGVWVPGQNDSNYGYRHRNEPDHPTNCEICELLVPLKKAADAVNELVKAREAKKKEYAESLESPRSDVYRIPYSKDSGTDFTYLPDLFAEQYRKVIATTGRKRKAK